LFYYIVLYFLEFDLICVIFHFWKKSTNCFWISVNCTCCWCNSL